MNQNNTWTSINNLQNINMRLLNSLANTKENKKATSNLKNVSGVNRTIGKGISYAIICPAISNGSFQSNQPNISDNNPSGKLRGLNKSISASITKFYDLKAKKSLANLLSFNMKKSAVDGPTSQAEKSLVDQTRRVSSVIDMNFRCNAGITNVLLRSVKDRQGNSSATLINSSYIGYKPTHSRQASQPVTPATVGYNGIRKVYSPKASVSIKLSRNGSLMMNQNKAPLESLDDIVDDNFAASGNDIQEQKELGQKFETVHINVNKKGDTTDDFQDLRSRPGSVVTNTRTKQVGSARPTTAARIKSNANLDSMKVTEGQRERLAQFLNDDFVNDLIYTKYYKVMDDEQKINALNNLKRQMLEHKAIRDQYNGNQPELGEKFFEQFNKTRRTRANLANGPAADKELDKYPGWRQQNQAFELFTPKANSPTFKRPSPKFSDDDATEGRSLNESPVDPSIRKEERDGDYYLNQSLVNAVADAEIKKGKKKKKKQPRMVRYSLKEEEEKAKYTRLRKLLKEKLLKCAQLKITAEEVLLHVWFCINIIDCCHT